jgi:hypothetical protein
MPIYEYIAADFARSCRICARGFELNRPLDRPPLERCFYCRNAVRKVISRVHTPRMLKPLSVSEAKSAGFTLLKRRDKGVYEKL